MARTNMTANRLKPVTSELITVQVLRRERISANFVRVTLGGGDIDRFRPMGFDHWFRLFIPVAENSLSRLPSKLNTLAYAKYLAIAKTERPVLRNYTVRTFRDDGPDGAELDVDFVIHGSAAAGTAGPAATWAETCQPGAVVAILDEGVSFNQPEGVERTIIVADETGLPAVAGILASLPSDASGHAFVELPSLDDRQDLVMPEGFELTWVPRAAANAVPGSAVLEAAMAMAMPAEPFYGWVVGEQTLPTTLRRHWVKQGVPKDHILFCGYWRAGRGQY